MNSIERASEAVGGQSALAAKLDVSPQAVYQWAKGLRSVPVERCAAVERATSGIVTRRDLRPNDWWLIWPELVTSEHPAPTEAAA
jgi:DNA-binding transcriptional regulator YdaS (Cro superfamily)